MILAPVLISGCTSDQQHRTAVVDLPSSAAYLQQNAAGVPLPADRPVGLTMIFPSSVHGSRIEISFQQGRSNVALCLSTPDQTVACDEPEARVVRTEKRGERILRVALMQLTPEETSKDAGLSGTPSADDVIAFWKSAALEESQPQWLAQVAGGPRLDATD